MSSPKANNHVLIECTYVGEKCVTWFKPSICNLVLHGFLAVMKKLICHPCALFQRFKNTSLPTSVYLNDFCPITASSRCTEQQPEMAGVAAKKQDMQTMQVLHLQAFIQTSDVSGVPEWANAFFALKRWADAQRGCPFLPCLHPKHTTSSVLPRSLFTDLHPHSQQAWPSMVTTFTLFHPSHNLTLPEVHRSTAGSHISDKPLHLLRNRVPLRISLPFRFRHFIVLHCRRSIQKWLILEVLQSFHHKNIFLRIPHWPLEAVRKSLFSLRFSREWILTLLSDPALSDKQWRSI